MKFDLLTNAKDSLQHAVEHITESHVTSSDFKRAILDVFHVVELLLKEKLKRINPAFIWNNIDKQAHTVNVEKALSRLISIGKINLKKEYQKTITDCKKIRNTIIHYEFEIEDKIAKAVIGRMLSFIFYFTETHLNINFEEEFKQDDTWKILIEIYEFSEAHIKVIEEKLNVEKRGVYECLYCGGNTYDVEKGKCLFCGFNEELIECERCGDLVWESETETYGDYESGEITICKNCIESAAYDAMSDIYEDR